MTYTISNSGKPPVMLLTNAPLGCGMCLFDEDDGPVGGVFVPVEWIDGVGLVRKKDPRE